MAQPPEPKFLITRDITEADRERTLSRLRHEPGFEAATQVDWACQRDKAPVLRSLIDGILVELTDDLELRERCGKAFVELMLLKDAFAIKQTGEDTLNELEAMLIEPSADTAA